MDSERWKRVDNLLQAVLERPPEDRKAFLRQASAGDEAREREVRSLLASGQEAGSFLESPAIEVAARGIALETAGSLIGQTFSHYRPWGAGCGCCDGGILPGLGLCGPATFRPPNNL